MPQPRYRSRTYRRVRKTTPGGVNKIFYSKRKPAKARCGGCGALLAGVPRERPSRLRRMSLTSKRPERPYGGVLCSRCLRTKMKEFVRNSNV
ncbi:MAG: 50S ribosomal protein L34e [Candidatus Woesearchaeota archaeon]